MSNLPWFRFYQNDWLSGTRGLKPATAGIYIHLLCYMYEHGKPVIENKEMLARICNDTPSSFKKNLEILINDGKILRIGEDNNFLWNERIEKEISENEEKSEKARKSINERWKNKHQDNTENQNGNTSLSQENTDLIPENTTVILIGKNQNR